MTRLSDIPTDASNMQVTWLLHHHHREKKSIENEETFELEHFFASIHVINTQFTPAQYDATVVGQRGDFQRLVLQVSKHYRYK